MKKTLLFPALLLFAAAGYTTPGIAGDALAGSPAATPDTRERFMDPGPEDTEGRQNGIAYRITGQENEVFSITFTYIPERETDPAAVIATALTVTGGGEIHPPAVIAYQTILPKYTGLTQRFRRVDPDTDIFIVMDIKGRRGVELRVTNDRPMDKTPVGTVVHSILPWDSYVDLMHDRPEFHAGESRWAPCDGRKIAGSRLARLWGKDHAPDLRGVFLRGLNRFDPEERKWTGVVDGKQKDLEAGRKAGSEAQGDTVGRHRHTLEASKTEKRFTYPPGRPAPRGEYVIGVSDIAFYNRDHNHPTGYHNRSGETRPRNVAVYYYIKIN